MPQNYKIVTPRSAEAVTLEEAKKFLKIDTDADDTIIALTISAAHDYFEQFTNWIIITTIFETYPDSLDDFELRRGNFQGLESAQSFVSGAWEDVLITSFENLQSQPFGAFQSASGAMIPVSDYNVEKPVRVRFKAGYTDDPSGVPAHVKLVLLQLIAYFYENRGDCSEENMPAGLVSQLEKYKTMGLR